MNLKKKPKKYVFYSTLVIFFILIIFFIAGWIIVDGNYDKQNRTILFLKKIIPNSISRKIRVFVFFSTLIFPIKLSFKRAGEI